MDMRAKLAIKPGTSTETAVIICDLHPNSIGIVVDSIDCVICPKAEEISEKPDIQGLKNGEHIKNVLRVDGKLILLLDIPKTLNLGDQQVISKSVAAPNLKAA